MISNRILKSEVEEADLTDWQPEVSAVNQTPVVTESKQVKSNLQNEELDFGRTLD